MRLGDIDGEYPADAGGVPVELVIALEEAELTGGAIVDGIDVLARRHICVGVARVDPDAIALADRLPGFPLAVAPHVQHLETDMDRGARAAGVAGGEIAIDAVVDQRSFRAQADRFGDLQGPVGLDGHVAQIMQNSLVGGSGAGPGQGERRQQRQQDAAHQPARPKLTLGAVWMLASSSA
ncbi:MAG: hypothetical protein QOG72_3468 [Sphingomonadales bacterium]|jgi:hypothetical protein|nr:hypothetical protein [Sphingomonadales bacterium]